MRPSGSTPKRWLTARRASRRRTPPARTPPGAEAGPGARSSRCTRWTWWCSPPNGATADDKAGCPTCIRSPSIRAEVSRPALRPCDSLLRGQSSRTGRPDRGHSGTRRNGWFQALLISAEPETHHHCDLVCRAVSGLLATPVILHQPVVTEGNKPWDCCRVPAKLAVEPGESIEDGRGGDATHKVHVQATVAWSTR